MPWAPPRWRARRPQSATESASRRCFRPDNWELSAGRDHWLVATRQRSLDEATVRGRRDLVEFGRQIRIARLDHGLSTTEVARALGWSHSKVRSEEHTSELQSRL